MQGIRTDSMHQFGGIFIIICVRRRPYHPIRGFGRPKEAFGAAATKLSIATPKPCIATPKLSIAIPKPSIAATKLSIAIPNPCIATPKPSSAMERPCSAKGRGSF